MPCCWYCQNAFSPSRIRTTDHKIPVSRGGTNARENKVACCLPCNQEKADLTHIEFIRFKRLVKAGMSRGMAWGMVKDDESAPRNEDRRKATDDMPVSVKEAAE